MECHVRPCEEVITMFSFFIGSYSNILHRSTQIGGWKTAHSPFTELQRTSVRNFFSHTYTMHTFLSCFPSYVSSSSFRLHGSDFGSNLDCKISIFLGEINTCNFNFLKGTISFAEPSAGEITPAFLNEHGDG